ncbi:MAG: hypothetical protein JSW07_21005 [bacterium]|nr:MAG: hypothetical protein JSW07_21005 [bacterium]
MKQKIFLLIIVSLGILKCNFDHGIAPLPGKIAVTIYFRGSPPKNTQGIYMIVAPDFPPHAINELYHSPNSLPIDKDTIYTEMELPYGHYDAISLWWYSTETESNLADVLALPLDPGNNLMPLGFDITPENPAFEIELYANWNRVDRDATIEGTIYFNGQFPKNTHVTAVAAYQYQPKENIHYLLWLKSMDYSIDRNPYHYRLPVRHGKVEYIAVFWLPEHSELTAFRTIGIYKAPNNPNQAGKLSISADTTITGIDIYADWSLISP